MEMQSPYHQQNILQYSYLDACMLQLTVQSWELGWNFTDGETLSQAADYFPNTSYPLPGSFNTSQVQLQSTALQADNTQQGVLDAWFNPQQVSILTNLCYNPQPECTGQRHTSVCDKTEPQTSMSDL